jgi:AhpD family alkylhydroperoxidase
MIGEKEKEIVAIGISVAAGCKPCTEFHVKAARSKGASIEDIKSAIELALSVRRRATKVIEGFTCSYLKESDEVVAALIESTEINRINVMLVIGAAFGVNCVSTLQAHLELAKGAGVSPDDITIIARLANYIKGKAALHVERLCGVSDEPGPKLKMAEASNG